MKSQKPPALATWLVEHAIPGVRLEALAGDLLEQFSQGRTAFWYWRQALGVVLRGYAKEWRVFAWAAAMTLLWAPAVNDFHYWSASGAREFFRPGSSQPWLVSFLSATAWFMLHSTGVFIVALSLYTSFGASSVVSQRWTELGLWRRSRVVIGKPLAMGYLVATLSAMLLLAILPARQHPVLVGNAVGLAPVFLGVIVMTFTAPSNNFRTAAIRLFHINPPDNW